MVETGFTRAKNAGNIIMKNLMDFCIGTLMCYFYYLVDDVRRLRNGGNWYSKS